MVDTTDNAKTAESSLRKNDITDIVMDLTLKGIEDCRAMPVSELPAALRSVEEILKNLQKAHINRIGLESLCQNMQTIVKTLLAIADAIQAVLKKFPDGSPGRILIGTKVSESEEISQPLQTLQSDLLSVRDITDKLKLSRRSPMGRILFRNTVTRVINNINDKTAFVGERLQIERSVILAALSDMPKALNEEERVLSNIPRAEGAEFSAVRGAKILQEGTREECMKALRDWTEEPSGSRPICVLVGEAGTGKSTIACAFSAELEEQGRLGASHFFKRGVVDLNSPLKFFSTVAWQLARSQPALRAPVIQAAREYLKGAALQRLEREFEELVRSPLRTLPPGHPPVFIVVDALDECTEDGPVLVPKLLDLLLGEALEPGSRLRVHITTRPEPYYIHKVFTAPTMRPHVSVISINDFRSSVGSDIKHFITARFAGADESKRWFEADPDRASALVEKSEGLFLYAMAAVDFILHDANDQLSMYERYQLLISGDSFRPLPSLDALYQTVLESVLPFGERYPRIQERLSRVLGYLAALQGPDRISPRILEGLTGMPTWESVPILNKLRSLVFFERDNVDSPFQIIHATFREFLVDRARSGEAFYVDPAQAHQRLASDCMRTMRSFVEEHWKGSSGAALLLRLLTEPLPDLEHSLPQLRYAYNHLDDHRTHVASIVQLIGEDDLLPISSVLRYLYSPVSSRTYVMWDLVASVLAAFKSLEFSSTQRRLVELLHPLATARAQVSGYPSVSPPGDHSLHAEQGAQVAILSIMLDIQGAAVPAAAADPLLQATSARIYDRRVEELANDLSSASSRVAEDIDELRAVLTEVHDKFHKAIVAAELTPGHQCEDEYAEYLRRKRPEDTDTGIDTIPVAETH